MDPLKYEVLKFFIILSPQNRPLLIVDITMLVVALLDAFVSVKMALHCYRTILQKKRDQLQYIRTPEGE